MGKLFCRLSLNSPEEGFNSYLRGPDSRDPEEGGDSSSPSVCSSSANDCKLPTKIFFLDAQYSFCRLYSSYYTLTLYNCDTNTYNSKVC